LQQPPPEFKTWKRAFNALAARRLRPSRAVRGLTGIFGFYALFVCGLLALAGLLSGVRWWSIILGSATAGLVVFATLYAIALAMAWVYLQAIRWVPPVRRVWAQSSDFFNDKRGPGLWPTPGTLASVFLSRDASVSLFPALWVAPAVVVAKAVDPHVIRHIGEATDPSWIATVLLATCAVLVGPMLLQSTRSGTIRLVRPSGGVHAWTAVVLVYVTVGVAAGALLLESGPLTPANPEVVGRLTVGALALVLVLATAGIAASADVGLARVRSRGVPRRYVVDSSPKHDIPRSPERDQQARPFTGAYVIHDDPLDPQRYEQRFIVHPNFLGQTGLRPLRRSIGAGTPTEYCWGHECEGAAALAEDLARDALDDFHVPIAARDAVHQLVVACADSTASFECRTADLEMALAFAGGTRRLAGPAATRMPAGGGGW
jgi:hypothetical protein